MKRIALLPMSLILTACGYVTPEYNEIPVMTSRVITTPVVTSGCCTRVVAAPRCCGSTVVVRRPTCCRRAVVAAPTCCGSTAIINSPIVNTVYDADPEPIDVTTTRVEYY